jgi:DNA-directed RNA polymerase subunit E'/Rpb7
MNYIKTFKITSQIVLSPHELVHISSAIQRHLEEKIGTCNKEYGYIMDIGNVDPYRMPTISKISGNCIYDVTYEIQTLKPEPGQVYHAQVQSIFPDGMFTHYKNINIFIPTSSSLGDDADANGADAKSADAKSADAKSADAKTPKIGDIIPVTILFIRYENHRFRCIGKK